MSLNFQSDWPAMPVNVICMGVIAIILSWLFLDLRMIGIPEHGVCPSARRSLPAYRNVERLPSYVSFLIATTTNLPSLTW